MITIFLPTFILLKKKLKSLKQKEPKLISWKKSQLSNCFPNLKIRNSTWTISPILPFSKSINTSSSMFPFLKGLLNTSSLALAGDRTPVVTSHRERKKRICNCAEKGITNCKCDRFFSQPDCDIGWDSSRDCYYHGYNLYMLVASDSESDLPVFPHLSCASRHDSHEFLHAFFRMKIFLPDYKVSKLLLDSAHDAMPYYEYCLRANITPFIDLNENNIYFSMCNARVSLA